MGSWLGYNENTIKSTDGELLAVLGQAVETGLMTILLHSILRMEK
jgi:hypothetical protein